LLAVTFSIYQLAIFYRILPTVWQVSR